MKTLAEIEKGLVEFSGKYNFPVMDLKQGTPEWLKLKLGVISGSCASDVVAKKGTEKRMNYLCELVAQVLTGIIEEENFKQMEWGKAHEGAARSTYEFSTDKVIKQVPFVFKDNTFREGCSPDGLIENERGIEIKCPWDTANYIKFFVADKIKSEWEWQNQFNLRVLGADEWDFVQYDPRMKAKPIKIVTIKKDAEKQAILDEAVPAFIADMDKMLSELGVNFGDQWRL